MKLIEISKQKLAFKIDLKTVHKFPSTSLQLTLNPPHHVYPSHLILFIFRFLNLAKRFSQAASIFFDYKFIVITSDHSSDVVMDFIDKEGFPNDIVVIDEDEFNDFGFVIDLDDMHAYIVDQCGRLAYIVVPPWSSAQHPYVKAALMSTIIDLPCGCPSDEFASHLVDSSLTTEGQTEFSFEDDESFVNNTEDSTFSSSTLTFSNAPVIDIETDDVENIEDLLDNSNTLNLSGQDGDSDFNVPMRIIIPSIHMHYDDKTQEYWKYDQFVLKTGNKSYHDHLQNGEKLFEYKKDQENPQNLTIFNDKVFVGNRSIKEIQKTARVNKIFLDRRGKAYKIHKEIVGTENVYELLPVDFDVVKVAPVQQLYGVKHHYEKLNRWLMFKV